MSGDAPVTWEVEQATAAGDGCDAGDTFFVAAGADVAVVFTRMDVTLAPDQGPNALDRHCRVDIPATVESGAVVDQLEQQIHYGWARTGSASGSLSARTWFFNRPLAPLEDRIDDGDDPVAAFVTLERADPVDPPPGHCHSGRTHTTLRLDFRLAAKRKRKADSFTLQLYGEDIHYQASMLWVGCGDP